MMAGDIQAVVITVSDRCSRGEQDDESGPLLCRLLVGLGSEIIATEILSDDLEPLRQRLSAYADRRDVNLVVTTGGTGFAPRDNTPEATRAVIQREAPGLAEAMRRKTLRQTPMAMISRGVCGIRSGALIVNLPGSPAGVDESFAVIRAVLPHAIGLLRGHSHDDGTTASVPK